MSLAEHWNTNVKFLKRRIGVNVTFHDCNTEQESRPVTLFKLVNAQSTKQARNFPQEAILSNAAGLSVKKQSVGWMNFRLTFWLWRLRKCFIVGLWVGGVEGTSKLLIDVEQPFNACMFTEDLIGGEYDEVGTTKEGSGGGIWRWSNRLLAACCVWVEL